MCTECQGQLYIEVLVMRLRYSTAVKYKNYTVRVRGRNTKIIHKKIRGKEKKNKKERDYLQIQYKYKICRLY